MTFHNINIPLSDTQLKQLEQIASHHRMAPEQYLRNYVASHIRIQSDARSEDFYYGRQLPLFCDLS